MACMLCVAQSKLQERRKKSAAIVSEAKNALNALKRQLETATAKASSSGIGEAQQKRMEEWTTELEKLEAGVESALRENSPIFPSLLLRSCHSAIQRSTAPPSFLASALRRRPFVSCRSTCCLLVRPLGHLRTFLRQKRSPSSRRTSTRRRRR